MIESNTNPAPHEALPDVATHEPGDDAAAVESGTESAADRAEAPRAARPSHGAQIVETTEVVLTALILAFVFRAFFIEPFIIPTGSMAPALLGAHATQLCTNCGWEFDYGPQDPPREADPTFVLPRQAVCPNCHERIDLRPETSAPRAGDRILVHKWPFAIGGWFGPRRWDVIVFRDPSDPQRNYIKRLIGLPNETIEIIDGDIYINDRIARKPAAAQQVLWSVVFDQDHVPLRSSRRRPGAESKADPAAAPGAGWSGLAARVLRYDANDDVRRAIRFDPHESEYARDFSAFNRASSRTVVRDLRLTGEITFRSGTGGCRLTLLRGAHRHVAGGKTPERGVFELGEPGRLRSGHAFTAEVFADGKVTFVIEQADESGEAREVFRRETRLRSIRRGRPIAFEFAHVDYRVWLAIDGRRVFTSSDDAYSPDLAALRGLRSPAPAAIGISASSVAFDLRHLHIDRDVYYTNRNACGTARRAHTNHPFKLYDGEYFTLGDNSPRSLDGRFWDRRGPHLQSKPYRIGTVRADQIVGRAFFVYLPGLVPLDAAGRWRIPDLGRVRFIR